MDTKTLLLTTALALLIAPAAFAGPVQDHSGDILSAVPARCSAGPEACGRPIVEGILEVAFDGCPGCEEPRARFPPVHSSDGPNIVADAAEDVEPRGGPKEHFPRWLHAVGEACDETLPADAATDRVCTAAGKPNGACELTDRSAVYGGPLKRWLSPIFHAPTCEAPEGADDAPARRP